MSVKRESSKAPDGFPETASEWAEEVKESFDDREWAIYHALADQGFEPFYGKLGSTAEADAIAFMCDYLNPAESTFTMLTGNHMADIARSQLSEVVPSSAPLFQEGEQVLGAAFADDMAADDQGFPGSAADVDFEGRAWKVSVASIDYLNRLCDEFGLPPFRNVDVLDEQALRDLGSQLLRKMMAERFGRPGGGDD